LRVLVTGANGLLGSFVTRRLLELSHQPKLLLRQGAKTNLITDEIPFCDIVIGDLFDTILLKETIKNCDVVIHCAGKVSFDPRMENEIFKTNLYGTANVVNACIECGLKKIIHVSSIAALGRKFGALEYNENSKWDDDNRLNSSYAKSKYLAELELYRGGEEGLDFSIVNPSIVIGPGDLGRSSTKLLGFVKKASYFYPNGSLNVVDVRDVAHVICDLLTIQHKTRLVLNSGSVSYMEFYELVSEGFGVSKPLWKIPTFVLRIVSIFDRIRTLFVGGEPLLTKESIKLINKNYKYKSLYYNTLFTNNLKTPQESIKWSIQELKRKIN